MASTTRYLFSRVYMCESGQVCMEAANKGCCSTLSFTQRARASSSLSHHHLTRKRRSVRQTWPGWILTFHAAPSMSSSIFRRTNEKNGGNIVCRYSIERLPEKRAPLHTSNPCDDVARLWLRSIYRWKTYVIAMHALCMPRLILFASIQVDDQSAARSPLRTLLRFFRVRVDRMWGSLWRKID